MDRRTLLTGMSGAAAESLLKAGRIKAMPDWGKTLRRDLLDQAMKG